MNKVKLNRKRIALFLVGLVLVYIAVPFPFLRQAQEADVREATIRWLLHHNHSGLQNRLKVCFIGLGTSFDPRDGDFGPHDPPADFVERFSNFPVPALPVSTSTNAIPPSSGNVDSPDGGGYFPVTVDAHGNRGLIFGAGDVKRWSLGFAVCRGMYHEGSLSAAGYDIFFLRLPFAWVPVWSRMRWIS